MTSPADLDCVIHVYPLIFLENTSLELGIEAYIYCTLCSEVGRWVSAVVIPKLLLLIY